MEYLYAKFILELELRTGNLLQNKTMFCPQSVNKGSHSTLKTRRHISSCTCIRLTGMISP